VAGDYAAELESVARALREQADGALFRQLTKAMRDGVEPAKEVILAAIPEDLPKRGGYAAVIETDLDLKVTVSTTGREPGVSIHGKTKSKKKRSLKRLDSGILWHPVFPGDTPRPDWEWKEQRKGVTAGWFTRSCEQAEPRVAANLEQVLEDVGHEVDRRAAGR